MCHSDRIDPSAPPGMLLNPLLEHLPPHRWRRVPNAAIFAIVMEFCTIFPETLPFRVKRVVGCLRLAHFVPVPVGKWFMVHGFSSNTTTISSFTERNEKGRTGFSTSNAAYVSGYPIGKRPEPIQSHGCSRRCQHGCRWRKHVSSTDGSARGAVRQFNELETRRRAAV